MGLRRGFTHPYLLVAIVVLVVLVVLVLLFG
jgi:hypothetical protein